MQAVSHVSHVGSDKRWQKAADRVEMTGFWIQHPIIWSLPLCSADSRGSRHESSWLSSRTTMTHKPQQLIDRLNQTSFEGALTSHDYVTRTFSTGGSGGVVSPLHTVTTNVSGDVRICDPNSSSDWLLVHPVCSTRYHSMAEFAVVAVVLSVITLWTILGNLLVLLALCRYGTLRTMSNCLIGNLAISDLLLAITVLPISTGHDLLGYWVFGKLTCTLWLCMDVLYCTASIWGLCTVAFDRYMATVYPVWYHDQRSVRKAIGCIVFVWIFSIVISFAPFIGWQHMIPSFFSFNPRIQRYECILFTSSSYVLYSAMGSFVIPAILMAFMYVRIFVVLHNQSKGMKMKSGVRCPAHKTNGCPAIHEPSPEAVNGVGRDATATTIISEATEGAPDVDNNTESDQRIETDHLLGCYHNDGGVDVLTTNGHHKHKTCSPINQSKRNSFMLPEEIKKGKALSKNLLGLVDLDRRFSHNMIIQRSASEMGSIDASKNELMISAVCHRSKSANVLTSEEGEALVAPPAPRRSLPNTIAGGGGLSRNNRMTLSMKRRFELREQRATKRMLLIMACFCVCWMPFLFMYILRSVCDTCVMNQHFVAAIIWLGYVNSSLNPVLYTLFNDDFRGAFKRLIRFQVTAGNRSPRLWK
ncbi:hypothetical protein Btru_060361 [Bulinus truncatus]|nr:hypothetical protein Btru_060361 [Bulinus truncatus]